MNGKNVLKRLQAVGQKLSIAQEDEEQKVKAEEITELLRQYEECMVERHKLPIEEQKRLEKQETEEVVQWYVELEKAYAEQLRLYGYPKRDPRDREEWQAYVEWSEAWNLEWEKTHLKNHDQHFDFCKTGGD